MARISRIGATPISKDMAGKSSVRKRYKRRRCSDDKDGISLKLSDKSALDCPICYHPLTIPVYQCTNGHVICSKCRGCLERKKCPSCSVSLDPKIRNRAIEKIVESAKVPCSHKGCAVQVTYSAKVSHEQTCSYAPYSCPFKGCSASGSLSFMYLYLKYNHDSSKCWDFYMLCRRDFMITLDLFGEIFC